MSDQNTDSGPDRRTSPRSPIVVREARCIAGMEVFFGCATNVSRSGMFIATPKLRDLNEEYQIQFRLPGSGREIRCRARVVWSRTTVTNHPTHRGSVSSSPTCHRKMRLPSTPGWRSTADSRGHYKKTCCTV